MDFRIILRLNENLKMEHDTIQQSSLMQDVDLSEKKDIELQQLVEECNSLHQKCIHHEKELSSVKNNLFDLTEANRILQETANQHSEFCIVQLSLKDDQIKRLQDTCDKFTKVCYNSNSQFCIFVGVNPRSEILFADWSGSFG